MSIRDIAWHGPRPLTPEDKLYGRADALDELSSRCQTYDVVEITAASGVGKTSFVAAGGIKALEAAGFRVAGPVKWPDALKHPQLADLHDDTVRFANVLYRVAIGLTGSDVDYDDRSPAELAKAAARGGKLVVVLDQMDELLRYRRNVGNAMLALAGEAAYQARVPHVVIARTEFRERLSPIEVPGATVWNLYLEEITSSRVVRRIIAEPAAERGVDVEITDEALKQLVDWWQEARAASGAAVDDSSSVGEVGLLHLQALLSSLKRWSLDNGHGDATVINADLLREFAKQVGSKRRKGGDGPALVDAALIGHVEAMIDRASTPNLDQRDEVRLTLTWTNGPRTMLARVAPALSSGGYKVPQTLHSLLGVALSEELGLQQARSVGSAFGGHLDREARIAKYKALHVAAAAEGIAKTSGFTGLAALDEMAEALYVAVESLSDDEANVLRKYNVTDEPVYELVHDRIGAALERWADRFQTRPVAEIDRVVARPGGAMVHSLTPETFSDSADARYWRVATQEPDSRYRLAGVCWASYYIGPASGGVDAPGRLRVEKLDIDDGDFTGAAFVRCDFANVTFSASALRGTVFIDCFFDNVTFRGHGAGATLEQAAFNRCSASSVVFDGFEEILALVAQDVAGGTWEFRDSPVRHLVFTAAEPTQVNFVESPLSHASFGGPVTVSNDRPAEYVESLPTDVS
jgi:hypothetical protein